MFKHPFKNPEYERLMGNRRSAQRANRDALALFRYPTTKQPNKYVPHYGAKEAAKYAKKGKL